MAIRYLKFIIFFLIIPVKAFATQTHGGSEGIIVHQFGHIFFLLSMCTFVYWLNDRWFLKSETSKRYFQLFGIFLILWNLDVIFLHFLDEQLNLVEPVRHGFTIFIEKRADINFIEYIYYFGKMDHILCVPALFFLYRALTAMEKESRGV